MILKVLAYITRTQNGQRQLLVFDHRDAPGAGTQVPAGTVEAGEPVEAALFREVWEESGLESVRLVRKLAEFEDANWKTIRHVYHLAAPDGAPDSWTHGVRGSGEDQGMTFEYRWVELTADLVLAGSQHQWLGLIDDPASGPAG